MRILNRQELTLKRPSAGYYDTDSNWVEAFTVTKFRSSVQPDFSGVYENFLPEGVRRTDCRVLHTQTTLVAADERTGTLSDIVEIEGNDFEVYKFFPWTSTYSTRLWHHQVLLLKKDKVS